MEAVDRRNRQSGVHSLINHESYFSSSKEYSERPYNTTSSISSAAVISPTNMYPNHPPPPYANHNGPTSALHSLSGMISPPESRAPDSRRSSDDPKDSQTHRQSLPSIREALDRPSYAPPPPPPSQPQPSTHSQSFPNPFSQQPPPQNSSLYRGEGPPYPSHAPHAQPNHPQYQRNSPPPPQPQAMHPPSFQSSNGQTGPAQDRHQSLPSLLTSLPSQTPSFGPQHNDHGRYQPSQRLYDRPSPIDNYPSHRPQNEQYQGYPSASNPGYTPSYNPRSPYRAQKPFPLRPEMDSKEKLDLKNGEPESPYVFVKTLKHNLANNDFEMALGELKDCGNQISKISEDILDTVQRYQRSDPDLQGVPSMRYHDSMLGCQRRVEDAFQTVKYFMAQQQHALDDQRSRNMNGKSSDFGGEDEGWGQERDQGFGSDAKKRRGRAAPPGRCHSCNRAETPEWRRGPDGARTLCNACGLHYAKLTRRMGSKQAQSSSSSIRPKSIDAGSPRS